MIIRILGEGQFRLDDNLLDRVNKIDNQIVNHVSQGNKNEYAKDLANLISTVKELAEPLDPVEILPSDIIIPQSDMSFEEARTGVLRRGPDQGLSRSEDIKNTKRGAIYFQYFLKYLSTKGES